MASQVMRITLKAYDHQLVDASAQKIIETVKKNGATVSGPVPLPTKKEVVTILRAVKHRYLYPLYHTGAFPDGRGFILRLERPF